MRKQRPPVVTVLGHVDHGKTTLLDYIRKSGVAKKEAGGITQSIGASLVKTQEGKTITFIDTPGHAAFSKMRSRGAKVADISILVVAADDGVKPQTKEALKYITEVNTPFVVALTKVDLPSSEVAKTKGELESCGVLFEGRGGSTPVVEVSAKLGTGIDDLLETISLMAEVADISGDVNAPVEAYVIETLKDKSGVSVSLVVKDGKLKVTDTVYCDGLKAKVRGLFDFEGTSVKEILPGYPCRLLGFSELPAVGSQVSSQEMTKKTLKIETGSGLATEQSLPIILKAANSGALEAVSTNIPQGVTVVAKSVGEVNQNDVFLAKTSNADIYIFESNVSSSVKKLADTEGVKIMSFRIIYELFDALEKVIKDGKEKILGKAQVIASFPYEKRKVAGCRLTEGVFSKTSKLRLLRDKDAVGNVRVVSLKKGKLDVNLVSQGEEFGLVFEPQLEFKIGDVLLSVQ